jgi:hypothetical protein
MSKRSNRDIQRQSSSSVYPRFFIVHANILQLGTKFDMYRVQAEREAAQNADTERLHARLAMIQQTDHEILEVTSCIMISPLEALTDLLSAPRRP